MMMLIPLFSKTFKKTELNGNPHLASRCETYRNLLNNFEFQFPFCFLQNGNNKSNMEDCLCSYYVKITYSIAPCTESPIPSLQKSQGSSGSGPPAHACTFTGTCSSPHVYFEIHSHSQGKLTRTRLAFLGTVFFNVPEKCLQSTETTRPCLGKMS